LQALRTSLRSAVCELQFDQGDDANREAAAVTGVP
jgi:hypothetical protein